MAESFLEKLEQGVLVSDGGMGTLLYEQGDFTYPGCFEELNLSRPELVKQVHLGYRQAGADILQTNTFGANRFRLRGLEGEAKLEELNRAGVQVARQVAGDELLVAGSVGPLGAPLEPAGSISIGQAGHAFREQIALLVSSGVDLVIIETMMDVNEAVIALQAARSVDARLPVVVQMTIREDGDTPTGTSPEEFTRRLDEAGADVIGLNCGVGPASMLKTLKRMASATTRKLSAQPNAGIPRKIEGRYIYESSPESMAEYSGRFVQAGAVVVGGCCGNTPDHIRMIRKAVRRETGNRPSGKGTESRPTIGQIN